MLAACKTHPLTLGFFANHTKYWSVDYSFLLKVENYPVQLTGQPPVKTALRNDISREAAGSFYWNFKEFQTQKYVFLCLYALNCLTSTIPSSA